MSQFLDPPSGGYRPPPGVEPAMVRRPSRAPLGVGLLALLLALGAGGVIAYQANQIRDLNTQAAGLQASISSMQGDLADASVQITDLKGSLAVTNDSLADTQKSLGKVDQRLDDQEEQSMDAAAIKQAALPSVVTVRCGGSFGSGFVIEVGDPPAGYASAVITNHHVVAGCTGQDDGSEVQVTAGESNPAAMLYSWDEANDLALLFVRTALPPLDLAETPDVGDPVVVIGSPYGLAGTVTTGVISNLHPKLFQTDATVEPGNSGGPLLDRNGQVLGVTTMQLQGSQGTNFAVRMTVRCERLLPCS